MFPNEVNILYEQDRYKDEIRQIQLENELRRSLRESKASENRNSGGPRSRFGLLVGRLSLIVRPREKGASQSAVPTGASTGTAVEITAARPGPCPEPCFAS
jgi:hypothetical protein